MLEHAADLSAVPVEFVDDRAVPVVPIRHVLGPSSFPRRRKRSRGLVYARPEEGPIRLRYPAPCSIVGRPYWEGYTGRGSGARSAPLWVENREHEQLALPSHGAGRWSLPR